MTCNEVFESNRDTKPIDVYLNNAISIRAKAIFQGLDLLIFSHYQIIVFCTQWILLTILAGKGPLATSLQRFYWGSIYEKEIYFI